MYIYDTELKLTPANQLNLKKELLEMLFIISNKMDNLDRGVVITKIRIKHLILAVDELNEPLSNKEKKSLPEFKSKIIEQLLKYRNKFKKYQTVDISDAELDLWMKKQVILEENYLNSK